MLAVLLDVDGTLVNSSEPILQALNVALKDNGLSPVTGDELWTHVGPPLHHTLSTLLKSRNEDTDLVPRLAADYRTVYAPLSIELAQTYPGVPEMLTTLEGAVRMGVVTSKPMVYAAPILERLGLSSYFEVIEGPDPALEAEPKTATLRRALDHIGVSDGSSAVMVGDRRQDVEAGLECLTTTVGVTWGFGTREELETGGADFVIDSPQQLVPICLDTAEEAP